MSIHMPVDPPWGPPGELWGWVGRGHVSGEWGLLRMQMWQHPMDLA